MDVEGNLAKITAGQLSRSLYLEVNECLMALGGRWHRKLSGHVFADDPRDALDQVLLTDGEFSNRKQDFGFFETPPAIAERIVRAAGVQPGHSVLEPSAGRGALLRALAMHIPTRRIDLTVIELMPENCRALIAAGWGEHLIETDFLLYVERPFDRILMNPPFARQADVDHVLHAHKLLAPGGRLVSVMSAGVKFRQNRKTEALRTLIDQHGALEDLPEHAFHDSGTDVRTVLATIDKR
jgi:cyclopropane fatty-acyl-phospholipid synthase-like methyltransferase